MKKDNKKLRIREWTAYLWCIDKETLKHTKGKATCNKDQQQQNIPVRWEREREKKNIGTHQGYNITIEFMFAGINMFWAQLRLILARALELITINITLEGIEKIKTEKNDNKTL